MIDAQAPVGAPMASPAPQVRSPRVAIIHEWFTTLAGSEKVVEQMCRIYPDAEIFCVVADPVALQEWPFLKGRKVHTTFIQRMPGALKRYRNYIFLMPVAIEQLDLSEFDLVISSSHAVAKGVLVGPDALHISYVHSPMRYAWDLQHRYLRESGLERSVKAWLVRWLLHKMRLWDFRTGAGVDHFVANSRFISRRIRRVYRRESDVIYPPVDVAGFALERSKDDFYLAASRMVPYKRMDLIASAFAAMPDKRLVIVGDGPDMEKVHAVARRAPNIEVLGYQPFQVLRDRMAKARAFVFAAEEDFGIMVVEAQACGTPVIAYGRGGARESIVEAGPTATGLFFAEQTVEAICESVRAFEAMPSPIQPQDCRNRATFFSEERFRSQFAAYVDQRWRAHIDELEAPVMLTDRG